MRRKKNAPPTSSASAAKADTAIIGPGRVSVPRSAHRNPSTTPTIGFSAYTVRHCSGRRLLGYAIGVANIQSCVRNGTTWRTSRNSTFSADSQSPTPSAVASASAMNAGNQTTLAVGATPWYHINPNSSGNVSAKSTSPASTVASGSVRRGKYTFVMRCALPTRLFDAIVRPVAKNVHGTSAAYANREYGTPSDGTRASRPKNSVNTSIVSSGCSTAQATPRTVCL